jgi:hypothetical protein
LLTLTPRAQSSVSSRSWLPTLQRFLPHSWVDSTLVTGKASKRDDAGMPSHLSDQRSPVLDTLCNLLLRVAITHLWKRISRVCEGGHGEDWRNLLRSHKARTASGRFLSCGKHTRREEENNNKWASTEHKQDKLVKNVTAGINAIGRFTDSPWWSWNCESTFFFCDGQLTSKGHQLKMECQFGFNLIFLDIKGSRGLLILRQNL